MRASRHQARKASNKAGYTRKKTCARCGRPLTDVESYVAELMPPAVCRDCSSRELEHLKMILGLSSRRKRARA